MLFENLMPLFFRCLFLCVRLSQKLTRKGWSPGNSRSSNCSACSLGKLCWTCLCTDRKGETLLALFYLWSPSLTWEMSHQLNVTFTLHSSLLSNFYFDSLSLPFSLSLSLPHSNNNYHFIRSSVSRWTCFLNTHWFLTYVPFLFVLFIYFFYSSWTYGSNSLPTAGSVSGGVARRGQRQFQMTPRGLPAGRMGLLSPGGISGASPRHTLTSPALAGQGRQVSIPVFGWAF